MINFNIRPFSDLFRMIKISCGKNSDISSTRLTSYIILTMIVMFCFYFIIVGVYLIYRNDPNLNIPNELIIVFGALLTHQLAILGINKNAETKQKISENNKNI